MSKASKLGKNPFEKKTELKARSLPILEMRSKTKDKAILEKIQELQIQIDWKELCKAALGRIF